MTSGMNAATPEAVEGLAELLYNHVNLVGGDAPFDKLPRHYAEAYRATAQKVADAGWGPATASPEDVPPHRVVELAHTIHGDWDVAAPEAQATAVKVAKTAALNWRPIEA